MIIFILYRQVTMGQKLTELELRLFFSTIWLPTPNMSEISKYAFFHVEILAQSRKHIYATIYQTH